MNVLLLGPDDEAAVEELLLTDPVQNLFLLGLLDTGVENAHWFGIRQADRILALTVVLGRLAVPFAPDPILACALGSHLRGRHTPNMIVGPREACDAMLAMWTEAAPTTFFDQRLYVLDAPPDDVEDTGLIRAQRRHAARVAELSAAMQREDLGRGPLNPDVHEAVVMDRITEGRTWITEQNGEIVFLINVGTRHSFGCQVGGTYVPPIYRGRGIATRNMRVLGRRLLERHPRVTLHVNEANTGAVRVYERSGFRRSAPFRLLIMEDEGL